MRYLLLILLLWLAPTSATAQPLWNDEWSEFGLVDGLITAGFGGAALTAELIGGPQNPRWRREVLFDLPLRRAVGSRRSEGEGRAALVSDIAVSSLMAAPFIDAGISYLQHDDSKFAAQYAFFSLQSLALTFGTTNLVKVFVGRARPTVADCFLRRTSDPKATCDPRPNVSFFSGHSSVAFTGAGLVCAFSSISPDRYPAGPSGKLPCAGALSLAATTAFLRLVANKHHLTDVLVGSAVGLLSGWAWPLWRIRQ